MFELFAQLVLGKDIKQKKVKKLCKESLVRKARILTDIIKNGGLL